MIANVDCQTVGVIWRKSVLTHAAIVCIDWWLQWIRWKKSTA